MNFEKTREDYFKDFIGQENSVSIIKDMISHKKVQNLILDGPSNVGKSHFVEKIISSLFVEDYERKNNLLYISVICDRCVRNIRLKLKRFSESSIGENEIKLVVIDNFDDLSNEVQFSLRRMIEIYSHKVRFVFKCSTRYKIINPIISRCVVLYFNHLSDIQINELGKRKTLIKKEKDISHEYNSNEYMESLFGSFKSMKIIYEYCLSFREKCGNYEHLIENLMLWIVSTSLVPDASKMILLQKCTTVFETIINGGNPQLNMVNLLHEINRTRKKNEI